MTQQMTESRPRETSRVSRILIVDDDPNIVQMLSDILTDEGYEVATATQSLRAFDRAKEAQPDLILMDIMMPYLDGWDELKLFNLDEELRSIPVIIVTADQNAFKGIEDAGHYGVVDHLFKPFELDELLATVDELAMIRDSLDTAP